jgi:hypothetical protein
VEPFGLIGIIEKKKRPAALFGTRRDDELCRGGPSRRDTLVNVFLQRPNERFEIHSGVHGRMIHAGDCWPAANRPESTVLGDHQLLRALDELGV